MSYFFKNLDESHTKVVWSLAKESLEEAWSEPDYRTLLAHPHRQHLGIFEDQELIGLLLAYQVDDSSDLIAVVIHDKKRKQGLGEGLVTEFKKRFHPKSIFLEVDPENISAVKLYLKTQFQVLGVRKKYYAGKRDAWSMKWESERASGSSFES